jgi:ABC-type sugar transport system ATPase subunit
MRAAGADAGRAQKNYQGRRRDTLYVTHDQAEALTLGDKVCVMHDGEIIQMAPPQEVYGNRRTDSSRSLSEK